MESQTTYSKSMAKEHRGSHSFILFVLLAAVLVLFVYVWHLSSAVKNIQQQTATAANQTITNASYTCDGGKTLQALFFNNTVELTLTNGRNMLLMQAISGSGVRYTNSDETFTFWTEGNSAFVEEGPENTVTYQNCLQTPSN